MTPTCKLQVCGMTWDLELPKSSAATVHACAHTFLAQCLICTNIKQHTRISNAKGVHRLAALCVLGPFVGMSGTLPRAGRHPAWEEAAREAPAPPCSSAPYPENGSCCATSRSCPIGSRQVAVSSSRLARHRAAAFARSRRAL